MTFYPEAFQIDQNGFVIMGGLPSQDLELSQSILRNIRPDPRGHFETQLGTLRHRVEVFDEPLVAQHCTIKSPMEGEIQTPYELVFNFQFSKLTLDEWDRFHGSTQEGIPFVLSPQAQDEFFDLLDEYGDDFILFRKKKHIIAPYWSAQKNIELSEYWTQIYKTEENPGWNLGTASPVLVHKLPQLKLPKSRVLVLGSGEGHDAAYFAEMGHNVTAVDFSEEALARSHKNYPNLKIHWIQKDVFDLPKEYPHAFDIVFEHTCFCAINPVRRNELTEVWGKLLHAQGYFMGIFFTMEKKEGPPFGASEWEIRQRLKSKFQTIIWERTKNSIPQRLGKELFVYAKKK